MELISREANDDVGGSEVAETIFPIPVISAVFSWNLVVQIPVPKHTVM